MVTMYNLVRIVLSLAISALIVFLIIKLKRNIKNKKALTAFAVINVFIICFVLSHIPFENAFITFSDINKAFGYVTTQNNIVEIVGANDFDAVISYDRENNLSAHLFRKTENGYKLGTQGLSANKIIWCNGNSILLCSDKKSAQSLIIVTPMSDKAAVSDSVGTTFSSFEGVNKKNIYYAVVDKNIYEYQVAINDEAFSVKTQ